MSFVQKHVTLRIPTGVRFWSHATRFQYLTDVRVLSESPFDFPHPGERGGETHLLRWSRWQETTVHPRLPGCDTRVRGRGLFYQEICLLLSMQLQPWCLPKNAESAHSRNRTQLQRCEFFGLRLFHYSIFFNPFWNSLYAIYLMDLCKGLFIGQYVLSVGWPFYKWFKNGLYIHIIICIYDMPITNYKRFVWLVHGWSDF